MQRISLPRPHNNTSVTESLFHRPRLEIIQKCGDSSIVELMGRVVGIRKNNNILLNYLLGLEDFGKSKVDYRSRVFLQHQTSFKFIQALFPIDVNNADDALR